MKTEHFNGLSEAEQERLVILAEECAEVQQVISKILRHGYESRNPKAPGSETNREALERELGDLMHALGRVAEAKDVNAFRVNARANSKPARIEPYLHHQPAGDFKAAVVAAVREAKKEGSLR